MCVLLILFVMSIFLLSPLYCLLNPGVDKAQAKRLEEELISWRNCRHLFSSGWYSSHSSSHNINIVEPQHRHNTTSCNITRMQLQCSPKAVAPGLSHEAQTGIPHKVTCDQVSILPHTYVTHMCSAISGPSCHINLMMCMCSGISDFSGYIIIIYKTWGKTERPWGERAWPYHLG